jgi:FixJ family two-component response regulator
MGETGTLHQSHGRVAMGTAVLEAEDIAHDMECPNLSPSLEVRHRLKSAGISLPASYITGKDNHATRMAAMASGCIAYLTKPFAARSLIEPLERASAGRA